MSETALRREIELLKEEKSCYKRDIEKLNEESRTCGQRLYQLKALVDRLLMHGQFWHDDVNLTRVICNCCGSASFDGPENIPHTAGCILVQARTFGETEVSGE